MALTIILNGLPRTFEALAALANVEELIAELGLKGDRVAVEYNGEIVRRTAWGETRLGEGDRLEVVHFVGGGSAAGFFVDSVDTRW